MIEKKPHVVQKVVTALVKAANYIQTHTPEQVAAAVAADLAGDRTELAETIRATKEAFTPIGLVGQPAVDTLVKVLESFGVFKAGQKVDIAGTYDMRFVRQAMKDLKLQ